MGKDEGQRPGEVIAGVVVGGARPRAITRRVSRLVDENSASGIWRDVRPSDDIETLCLAPRTMFEEGQEPMLSSKLIDEIVRVIDALIDAVSPRPPKLVPVPVRPPRRTPR